MRDPRGVFAIEHHRPPAIVRSLQLEVGAIFHFWGRPMRIERVLGTDPAAPVIVEELEDAQNGSILAGQLSMWSADSIMRLIAGEWRAPMKRTAPAIVGGRW